jgi:3-oxoacyl-[acyl-carrier protein] reductase
LTSLSQTPLFDGDTAVVTGAGNGIGRAIAQALAAENVRTVFADIDPKSVGAAVAAAGDHAIAWSGDLSRAHECDRLYEDALRELGRITLFVHSASPKRLEKDHLFALDDETWRAMHGVNLDCAYRLGRRIAQSMIENKIPGRMLFVTSLHADTPRNLPHYSTAKAAPGMLVKEFAKALGRYGIRVNALAPGAIAGGGFTPQGELAKHIPLGRLGTAEDLAPMALAVLSQRFGAYVTGSNIVVDGGIGLTNWFEPPDLAKC